MYMYIYMYIMAFFFLTLIFHGYLKWKLTCLNKKKRGGKKIRRADDKKM